MKKELLAIAAIIALVLQQGCFTKKTYIPAPMQASVSIDTGLESQIRDKEAEFRRQYFILMRHAQRQTITITAASDAVKN